MSEESKVIIRVISFDEKEKLPNLGEKFMSAAMLRGYNFVLFRSKSTQAKQSTKRYGQRFIEAT